MISSSLWYPFKSNRLNSTPSCSILYLLCSTPFTDVNEMPTTPANNKQGIWNPHIPLGVLVSPKKICFYSFLKLNIVYVVVGSSIQQHSSGWEVNICGFLEIKAFSLESDIHWGCDVFAIKMYNSQRSLRRHSKTEFQIEFLLVMFILFSSFWAFAFGVIILIIS